MPGRFFCKIPILTLVLSAVSLAPLSPAPRVTLVTPTLIEEFSAYQEVLDEYALEYRDEIAGIVSEALDKPLFMEGFGSATAAAAVVPGAVRDPSSPFIGIGSTAAVFAEGLSPELADELASIDPESDMKAGMCIQPVVINLGFPLPFFNRSLYLGASFGYIDADTGDYGMKAVSAGGFAGCRLFAERPSLVSWDGISLEAGGDWTANHLAAVAKPGEITQDVPLDPDGNGPLVPQHVTLRVDPVVRAGIDTNLVSARASLRTGVTFFRALSLYAGGGLAWARTRTGISVESSDEFEVEGDLESLLEPDKPGSISIDGTAAEYATERWLPFIQAGLMFRVGAFGMSLPVIWKPGEALGTGVFFGINL